MASSEASTSSSSKALMRVGLDDSKAGMKGLDKDRINKIIADASKGSKFFLNEQRREAELRLKIDGQLERLARVPASEALTARRRVDVLLATLDAERDLSRTIVHVDMDCFYAAVHMRDDPSLKTLPMAVGSDWMLSTSNYVARRFGVRAAMPGFIAKKLCPDLILVPVDFARYEAVAGVVRAVVAEFDPDFESGGCDEAYLDLTEHLAERERKEEMRELVVGREEEGCCKCGKEEENRQNEDSDCSSANAVSRQIIDRLDLRCPDCDLLRPGVLLFDASVADAVAELRLKIFLKTRLTASAGVAPNAPLAKICSDQNKPDGQFLLDFDREAIMSFVRDLPIRKWPFIGKVSEKMVNGLGVFVIGDIYDKRVELALTSPSEGHLEYYLQAYLGLGRNHVGGGGGQQKSVSCETSFPPTKDPRRLRAILEDLCADLARDCEAKGLEGKTVTLKLKRDDFRVLTRSSTLGKLTKDSRKLLAKTSESLEAEIRKNPQLSLRLMGVKLAQLRGSEAKDEVAGIERFFKVGAGVADGERDNGNDAGNRKMTEYVCPLCEEYKTTALREMNEHVDECLLARGEATWGKAGQGEARQGESCGKGMKERKEEEERPSSDLDLFDDDDDYNIGDSASPQPLQRQQQHPPPLYPGVESFVCPVCGRSVEGNLSTINLHIDDCLDENSGSGHSKSRSANDSIKETASTRSHESARVKGKRKRRDNETESSRSKTPRIEKFFAVKS